MDISREFTIDNPNIAIRWGISPQELRRLFERYKLDEVSNTYFITECLSLGDLRHKLGFHFDKRGKNGLVELEFIDSTNRDISSSFKEFQEHLELTFGLPTTVKPGSEGYPAYSWFYSGALVEHYVEEHFGPAQSIRIRRTEFSSQRMQRRTGLPL